MANYTTLLNTWGDTGTAYPSGYSYLEGEQPVDAWDNFLIYNVVDDLQSLITLTNDRIETSKGTDTGFPTSPEDSHLYHDTVSEALHFYDAAESSWHRVLAADGDALEGALDFAGFAAQNVGTMDLSGTMDVAGQDVVDGGTTIYDASSGRFSDADKIDGKEATEIGSDVLDSGSLVLNFADLDFDSGLSATDNGDGSVSVDVDPTYSDDTHTAISEDGSQMVGSVNDIDFRGHLNVINDGNGNIRIDPAHNHDSRYINDTGDTMSGALTLSDGSTAASRSWVNGNADVPNADYADNADKVDGSHVFVQSSTPSGSNGDVWISP